MLIRGNISGIPSNITAMQGQVIGPPLGEIEIAAGDCLYLKVKRTATGDGVISGPVSIAGDVVSVTDGTNTASVTVSDFDTAGESSVLAIETIAAGAMRIGTLVTDAVSVAVKKNDGSIHDVQVIGAQSTDKVYIRGLQ